MTNNVKCVNCGGTQMESGTLHSTGSVYFRPSDAKFMKFKTANIDVFSNICLNCGYVNLIGDLGKLKELTDKA